MKEKRKNEIEKNKRKKNCTGFLFVLFVRQFCYLFRFYLFLFFSLLFILLFPLLLQTFICNFFFRSTMFLFFYLFTLLACAHHHVTVLTNGAVFTDG